MREPKQKRSQRTLAKLLTAAAELFETQGVDATGMTEVAKRAGSSVGSLYGRFEGKTDLVLAVDRLLWERVATRWNGSTDSSSSATESDSAVLLVRLHQALAPEHLARISIGEFLRRENRDSEGSPVLTLLASEVQAVLVERLAPVQSSEHGAEVLRFLSRIAVDEANAGRGVDSVPQGTAEEIAKLSVGDPLGEEPSTSGHLAFVIDATLAELGGGKRTLAPKPERTAPAVDPFDIWA